MKRNWCSAGILKEYGEDVYEKNTLYQRLRPAIDFMDREYVSNPSLPEVASHANMAPNYFHCKFKELFHGQTPHSYMEQKRLNSARTLLLSTSKNLK